MDAYRLFFENVHRLQGCDYPPDPGSPWNGITIPGDVRNILDVGCAGGDFLHSLPGYYKKTGVDICNLPLRRVRCPAIAGSIDRLPFKPLAFDLVTSFEVLEHLPVVAYRRALYELQRISRKHIIISVPNRQRLEQSLVGCPECFCRYNPDWHVRSFERRTLESLFQDFRLIRAEECGPFTEDYPGFLEIASLLYKRKPPNHGVCPQCGFSAYDESGNTSGMIPKDATSNRRNVMRRIASRFRVGKRHYWLRGYYERMPRE